MKRVMGMEPLESAAAAACENAPDFPSHDCAEGCEDCNEKGDTDFLDHYEPW